MSPLSAARLKRLRRSRLRPRPTQFDYVHLRYVVDDLQRALAAIAPPPIDVLDVWCGSRAYDELLPAGARCVGLDIDDSYGVADVVSTEFLPFEDQSFDLVLCMQAFHYAPEPRAAVEEIRRVLRPGGAAIVAVPFMWEYDPTILEHRYTGPELSALFEDWDDVTLVESGGRAVCWSTLTGTMLHAAEIRCFSLPLPARLPIRLGFRGLYVLLNALGAALDRVERRAAHGPYTLPMNLQLTAVRPAGG